MLIDVTHILRRIRLAMLFVVAMFTLAACTHTQTQSHESSPIVSSTPLVHIVMTVDWEGAELTPANLQAMAELRRDYPFVPILHYLNAAYFTKPHADAADIRRKISSVLLPGDQLGLHIHGWRTLFEAAGVPFRRTPSVATGNVALTDAECVLDCGHTIDISAYTESEIGKVIDFSISTLSAQGFGHAVHFRAGAWMLGPDTAAALAARGFVTDSSALPADYLLGSKWGKKPLYTLVHNKWPSITPLSQPYALTTARGSLHEVPDNGCLADYMTAEQMIYVIKANIDRAQTDKKSRYVVIGFHQETAARFLPQIRRTIDELAKLDNTTKVAAFAAMPAMFPNERG